MIELTENAAIHIKKSISRRGSGIGIRLGVRTTGCSGLAYVLEYVDVADINDYVVNSDDVSVYVDPKSAVYLDGITVEYEKNGLQEGLVFINPNERAKCGCGESFSI